MLDLLEVSSVVGIGMVGELLARGPEDDVIARAIKVPQQRNTKKHGRKRKRQSGYDDK